MKLSRLVKEIQKIRSELLDNKPILVRFDDEVENYQDWLKKQGVYDEDVIVVNIWIPSL